MRMKTMIHLSSWRPDSPARAVETNPLSSLSQLERRFDSFMKLIRFPEIPVTTHREH